MSLLCRLGRHQWGWKERDESEEPVPVCRRCGHRRHASWLEVKQHVDVPPKFSGF
jgi:hypothetical protein